jgi:elongation factor P--beta-lysine ligase
MVKVIAVLNTVEALGIIPDAGGSALEVDRVLAQ